MRVYIETSVISYLVARPSRNIVSAAWQQLTQQWWDNHREHFDLYISELVEYEASQGNPNVAKRRCEIIQNIDKLERTENVRALAKKLISEGPLPKKAIGDATHVAIAAVHGIDYLLTWNFRHLDNAEMKPLVRSICAIDGYICPEICTPQELMGELDYD